MAGDYTVGDLVAESSPRRVTTVFGIGYVAWP